MIDLIKSRLNTEQLFYDDKWITDGNIVLKRDAVNLEEFLKNAIKKEDGCLTKLLSNIGDYIAIFPLHTIYKNAIYNLDLDYSLIPIEEVKDWYVDSRWFSKVYDFLYDIDNIYVYEYKVGPRIGPILEVKGWANRDDFIIGKDAEPIAYILGIITERQDER